jgi:glucose dehydrogenase
MQEGKQYVVFAAAGVAATGTPANIIAYALPD